MHVHGMLTHDERSQLRTAVVQATEQHHKGLPLVNSKARAHGTLVAHAPRARMRTCTWACASG